MSASESSSAKRARDPQRAADVPRFIVIEGPLRVGKTTLAKILAEKLHAKRVYDCEDNPFLAEFYKEKPGSALRAQMYFLIERQRPHTRSAGGGITGAGDFRFPDGKRPDFCQPQSR